MTSVKPPNFDPSEDLRQGASRLQVIYYIAIGVVAILAGRLWFLQVMKGELFEVRAEDNRIQVLRVPARRGTIYDRKGRQLVTSKASYNIVLSRKGVVNFREFSNDLSSVLVAHLGIDEKWLAKRFEDAVYEPKYESIVVKELASPADVAWVESHQLEYPMIRAEQAPQRVYVYGEWMAHALGYVGEVSPDELKRQGGSFSKEKGFKLGDIIGKFGIERTYNEILMGKDGERRVMVDSRGRIQPDKEVEVIQPVPGRDLYTTLDLDIQMVAEEQGDTMPAGRGAIAVMDPNNGEILAMVSRPSFDPNLFSQAAKTPEGKEEISKLYEDEGKPLYNRVIQGAFPPGSTWKLMTAVAALNEGVITPTDSKIQDGGIQLGNYYMSSMSHLGYPDVRLAIEKSADGYFYRLGIKMGPDRFEKWVERFGFGKRTGIDLPNERSGTTPTRATKQLLFYEAPKRNKERKGEPWTENDDRISRQYAKWTEYDMAASAFGQGQNASTPVQLLRYTGGLANGGFMHTPHLLLRAVSGTDRNSKEHPEVRYEDKNRFQVPMNAEIHQIVKDGMWRAVNSGTAGRSAVEGFDICAKTGTAQVASKDKAGSKNKDHAWIISFAPKEKPEICSVILTENAGFGGTHSAPRAQAIYADYYKRTRGITDEIAEESAESGKRSPRPKSATTVAGVKRRASGPGPQTRN